MVTGAFNVRLARYLHDHHHGAEGWDACSPACQKFYLGIADSAIVFFGEKVLPAALKEQEFKRRLEERREQAST